MSDRLYDLLPVVYRARDVAQREELRGLLRVIGEQVQVIEDDIAALYENWFIETCADWVVPYLGDLVGHHGAAPSRRAVANVIRDRRRKGTLALLADLAPDVAGWPGRAVEFRRGLGVTQPVHLLGTSPAVPRLWGRRGRWADLRRGDALDRLGGPHEELARTVDVRRVASARTQGRFNIPSVGLFVWRLKSYPVTRSQALCLEEEDPRRYTFSILGNDAPLFAADPPAPIRRRDLARRVGAYYGEGRDLEIWAGNPAVPIPAERIVAADLSGWRYPPMDGHVAVDPELGRILFGDDLLTVDDPEVLVSYRYGFSADIGGGEYDRPLPRVPGARIFRVRGQEELERALAPWQKEAQLARQPRNAIIEIGDSRVYDVPPRLVLREGHVLHLRAANRTRPVIRLPDRRPGPDALHVSGGPGSRLTLDGLLVTGNAVRVSGDLAALTIRHCTLVPGWGLGPGCEPLRPAKPGLMLVETDAAVCVERSIVGSIQVAHDAVRRDPERIVICDGIVDATSSARSALCALGGGIAHAAVTLRRVTVIGRIGVHAIELAENCVLDGRVEVARRRIGCVRFCSVVPGSRTPRRFACQPDLVEAAVIDAFPPGPERDRALARERVRVRPAFEDTRYGTPRYARLSPTVAEEIARGADDESELGAFHHLQQPRRTAALSAALTEFTPSGADAGIIEAR